MNLNENNMSKYVIGKEYSYGTLKSMSKDNLIELLNIAQHNYECVNAGLFNLRQYVEMLDKALDKACDFLEKSKIGTSCDEEYHKKCNENHCSSYCIHSRKMTKEEWRKYLMEE